MVNYLSSRENYGKHKPLVDLDSRLREQDASVKYTHLCKCLLLFVGLRLRLKFVRRALLGIFIHDSGNYIMTIEGVISDGWVQFIFAVAALKS